MKRNTWQREAVREALGDTAGFVSAQSLHQTMREQGSEVGLATVYRALADLATEGTPTRCSRRASRSTARAPRGGITTT
ncbi:hypothetical protein GCM10025881_20270 [Pseudolysinimonas kribbensis]|uniref:Transcriptional repressor n=1 Tax=Pseudolysinimonas kribbensis TaxID=433641 RepID=A0ABQ6K3K1_9MICO|nr:hypothetical protein GCM10025881_20270 [Pseudolysinimonas kribbensis]